MAMHGTIVTILASLALAAAVPANQQRIVGGTITTISQFSSAVGLLYGYNGVNFQQYCGGLILTPLSILTAAHCPYGDAASQWRVRAGSSYASSGGSVHNVQSIIIHPQYNPRTSDSDVSILKLSSRLTYNNNVQPGSIPGANYYLADNEPVIAVGWGATSSGGYASEQLRQVQVWTVNQATCRQRYAEVGNTVTDNMLCSGWLDVGGRDQCQGDSGGPLYHNNVSVGICSWGRGCAQAYFPGVNTRVSRFTNWITSNA